jgi:hypothetical protein
LKIELLEGEEATKVKDRNADALAHKRAQINYKGLCCAHCKEVGDSVTLAEHVNVVYVFLFFSREVLARTKI